MTVAQVMAHEGALKERIARALVPRVGGAVARSGDGESHRGSSTTCNGIARSLRSHARRRRWARAARRSCIRSKSSGARPRAKPCAAMTRASADARHLAAMLYPHRHPQERFYSILPFLAQHGLDLSIGFTDAVEARLSRPSRLYHLTPLITLAISSCA